MLAGFVNHGYKIGGFKAYITSDVLIGAGLSSSAAYETLIGNILSGLYNDMSVSAEEIAIIGQFAENVYFGKPCGLMDQMACSVGNLVHVDLTADYASIPEEMKKAAAFFGKEVLLGLSIDDILDNISKLRELAGDRGVLRTIHFIRENERVQKEVAALSNEDIEVFLKNVKASGNSSYKYLQNVYSNADVQHQNVSIALVISEDFLGDNGVCRVHGGGFAGTIQTFVKKAKFYEGDIRDRAFMDSVFEKEDIDGVIHFAASSQVGESMKDPLKYYSNNLCGTEVLLESMVAHGIDKIVFSSTAATYGEPESIPILETDRTLPTNCYGETKLSMEKMFKWTSKAHNLRFVSLRYFNACGAHPNGKIGEKVPFS